MYEIRAPQKSQRISYQSLSPAQQQANRQAAISVLRATSSMNVTTPEQMVDGLAHQFYSVLAPQKSQSHPWHTRSDFHHSWYRNQATQFLTTLLNGLQNNDAFAEAPSASAELIGQSAGTAQVQGQLPQSKISIQEVQALEVGAKDLKSLQIQSGEEVSDLGDQELHAQPQRSSMTRDLENRNREQSASLPSRDADKIATLLGVVAILLVVLIIVVIVF